jgi:DNA (cytosine-5)-methyltransferase 1
MDKAYYNEIDPHAAQWLRNLIAAGHVAPGDVDERSIEDVRPDDIRGYTQCHFFAGIGVWSYALRLAGWSDDRPVWTGSCPCQPFSAAGQGLGFADERHLWPAWFHLIKECRPAVLFGEQVASKDAEPWLDLVQDDLEALDYAVGAVPLPAAGIGAPHIRDRLYWLADASREGLAQRKRNGRIQREALGTSAGQAALGSCTVGGLEYAGSIRRQRREAPAPGYDNDGATPKRPQSEHGPSLAGTHRISENGTGPTNGFWRDADWLACTDGKWRPVEPGTFPLAHGVASRVGRLRAYGNAIVAQAAKEVIAAYMENA